jgi:putative transposase
VLCPKCRSMAVKERPERTAHGYRRFRCLDCTKQFNERSGGLLNRSQYPSDVAQSAASHRASVVANPPRHMSTDGVSSTGSTSVAPGGPACLVRQQQAQTRRFRGHRKYLNRAIDRDGALVDVMLSEHCNLAAAKRLFRSAKAVTCAIPDRVTTDGHDAYPQAIRTELGSRVRHLNNAYLNNRLEQDHRGIKGRCRLMLGFKSVPSARRFYRGHDEFRNFLRSRSRMCQCSRRYPARSVHASNGHRAGYSGSCLNNMLYSPRLLPEQARKLTESPR